MNYPVTTFDSLGARQLPKDSYIKTDEVLRNRIVDKDYFGNIIQSNDRVFELTFEVTELNKELQVITPHVTTEIATQSTIAELIDELGAENLNYTEHLGLGKEIYGGRI